MGGKDPNISLHGCKCVRRVLQVCKPAFERVFTLGQIPLFLFAHKWQGWVQLHQYAFFHATFYSMML